MAHKKYMKNYFAWFDEDNGLRRKKFSSIPSLQMQYYRIDHAKKEVAQHDRGPEATTWTCQAFDHTELFCHLRPTQCSPSWEKPKQLPEKCSPPPTFQILKELKYRKLCVGKSGGWPCPAGTDKQHWYRYTFWELWNRGLERWKIFQKSIVARRRKATLNQGAGGKLQQQKRKKKNKNPRFVEKIAK